MKPPSGASRPVRAVPSTDASRTEIVQCTSHRWPGIPASTRPRNRGTHVIDKNQSTYLRMCLSTHHLRTFGTVRPWSSRARQSITTKLRTIRMRAENESVESSKAALGPPWALFEGRNNTQFGGSGLAGCTDSAQFSPGHRYDGATCSEAESNRVFEMLTSSVGERRSRGGRRQISGSPGIAGR